MPKGQPKAGLRVKYSADVSRNVTGKWKYRREPVPPGFFIWVRVMAQWQVIQPIELRFVREQDALRAAQMLTLAGLDTVKAMRKAGAEAVQRVACRDLQW